MAGQKEIDVPEYGAVFTFGRSRFADNVPSHFYIRNDPVVEVACGDEHTAVICQKGRVFVFGNNDYGQLGLGHKNVAVKPSCVKSLKPEKAVHVACGRAHTMVSTASGKLFSWGNNSDGQLGVGDIADRAAPTRVMGIQEDILQLSAGCVSSAALTDSGQVYVWGSNSDGQLGLMETSDNILSPLLLPFDEQIVQISCGYYHTAFLTGSGDLYTCGESESGKLGLPDSLTNITTPQKVMLGVPVKSVFCGGSHTIALTADGEVFAFGNNFNGQLGLGIEVTQSILPTRVICLEGHIIKDASCGESHTAFVTCRGNLYTCGEGRHGKLCGEKDNSNQTVPVKATRLKEYVVQKVACGGCHTMVLASERKEDESCDSENEVSSLSSVTNRTVLPPLQRVPVQNSNNNLESMDSLHEYEDSHLEEITEQSKVKVKERSLEIKSILSESKGSSDEDIDADEEISLESTKSDVKTEWPTKESSLDVVDTLENSEVEDEIKNVDVISEAEDEDSDSDSAVGDEDNADVSVDSEKKESRVTRFFNSFRRKKPTSAQSVGVKTSGEQLAVGEKRKRAASEGRVRGDECGGGDAQQDRHESGKSKSSNFAGERRRNPWKSET